MDKSKGSKQPTNMSATHFSVKEAIYKTLLKIIHMLFTCAEIACQAVQTILNLFLPGHHTPPLATMTTDAQRLEKRPQHMGVIVVESAICWETLADIILWSLAYGIEYVSVYDRSGRVRAGADAQLRPPLERKRRQLFGSAPASVVFEDAAGGGGGGRDGGGRRVTVALLWEPDGVGDMVAAARRLCGEVAAGARQPDSIDRHMFGGELRAARRWPDPALALKLGPLRALLGYLPWQLRLTEVLDAPARRPLAYDDFRRLLQTYGGIQQRMGS